MHRRKEWIISPAHPEAEALAARLKTSPLLAQVLLNRGISDADACERFLHPTLKTLPEPGALGGLNAAAERIARAIRDHEKIVIYGDYDVDGITGTSILWHAFTLLGGVVDYYIPHRVEEGYGLNAEALGQILDDGAKLVVTVDCGITAVEEAKLARERGVDLIITDHHEWRVEDKDEGGRMKDEREESSSHPSSFILHPPLPSLPDCFAIVHPRLPGEGADYPNPHLCGAGVAFKVAWGVGQAVAGSTRVSEAFRDFLVDATALAALGTIADVVPLVGENRALAHFGLGGLKQSKMVGIKALIESAGLSGKKLDSYDVGFKLGPRLNACGRMGHARLAVEMLTRADAARALEIANYLEQQNRQRQATEKKILDEALAQAAELKKEHGEQRALVLGQEGWHPGVIGIVASRLVDRFHRPAVMVALNNGVGQGSARSVAGFHLAKALDACDGHLVGHGGHEMAAGLRVKTSEFEMFRQVFCHYANENVTDDMLTPRLHMEAEATLPQITLALVNDLKRMGPFGQSNPRPLLCCKGVTLAGEPRRVGKGGDHLQLYVRQNDKNFKCIAFNQGAMFDQLRAGSTLDLSIEPAINEYMGRTSVELLVKDLHIHGG